jgi:hypothetical protein
VNIAVGERGMRTDCGSSCVRGGAGGWVWKHSPPYGDAVSRHFFRTFATSSECIADAKLGRYDAAIAPGRDKAAPPLEPYGLTPSCGASSA